MSGQTAWLRHRVPEERIWRIADARGQVLGRLATQITSILMGKHKPVRFDNMDCSDPIVVINARHFELTGRKKYNKEYIKHSGYPGGLKRTPIHELMDRRPEDALRNAIYGMLPRNKLRAVRMRNLHIFLDEEHPFQGRKPVLLPPAYANADVRKGGPPTAEELERWWITQLADCPEDILAEVMREVREEAPKPSMGLAEALRIDDEAAAPEEHEALAKYLKLASEHDTKNPVIMPDVA